MIHYILGRTGSGKSYYIHQHIKARLGKEKLLLIVPEQYTLQAEVELIEDLNSQGIIDVEVMSFNRLCHKVIEETGELDAVEINSLGKAMVLRSLLDKHHEELMVFNSVSMKTGFIDKLSTLVTELKRVGYDHETIIQHVTSDQKLVDRKMMDVAKIMSYYEAFMEKGYFDEEDKFKMVLEKLSDATLIKDAVLYIDGFDSFSSQEYLLLEALLKMAKDVYLSLTIDIHADATQAELFMPVVSTFKKIRKITERLEIKEKKVELHYNDRHGDLAYLESSFFSFPYGCYDQDAPHLELHYCNNYYEEIELIAEKIIAQIRQKGYRFSDINVITGNLETYGPVIKRVFSEYQIPLFIDDKITVLTHPLVQYMLSVLSAINSGFKYEDMFRLLKTQLTGVDVADIDHLENHALKFGLRGNRWEQTIEDAHLESVRQAVITPLLDLKKHMKNKGLIKDYVTVLYQFLIDNQVPESLEKWIEHLKSENKLDNAMATSQIWNKTVEIFDQLVELEGEDKKTLKEFIRILEAGFNEIQLGLIPPSLDQVIVGSIERSKTKGVKATYVIGLNDGIIPKKYSDEGLILEDEKQYLKSLGLDLETDATQIIARDRLSTYIAFAKAKEQICFSFSLSDHEGKALRPSLYVDRLKKIYPMMQVHSHVQDTPSPTVAITPENHLKKLTSQLRDYKDQRPIDEAWFAVLAWFIHQDKWSDKAWRLNEALHYDNQLERIQPIQAKQLYDLPLSASVSRLERFNRCPFSHFIHYGLRPKERAQYEIRLPDIGSLFHKTLENFDDWMKSNDKDWHHVTREEVTVEVDRIVDELVEDFGNKIFESSHRYRYMVKKLKRVGTRAVWTLVHQVRMGLFQPYAHEIAFSATGQQFTVPPIVIELSSGERMLLEGRIDRIDLYEHEGKQYVKIIDYKSGSKKFSLSDVYQGLQLQLMVYLDAILENSQYFRKDALYPAGVFYFKIDDPLVESELNKEELSPDALLKLLKMDGLLIDEMAILEAMDKSLEEKRKSDIIPVELKKDDSLSSRSKTVSMAAFSDLIEHIKGFMKELGENIHDGISRIEPFKQANQTACQYCDYKNICQFDTAFGNNYKYIDNLKDKEVIEALKRKDNADA